MACHKIPASIMFSPRHLKDYKRWQLLYTNRKSAEQAYIPTAIEYDEFQQWLKRQDSGYFSDIFEDIAGHVSPACLDAAASTLGPPVALVCQHTMHPIAAGEPRSRCPVCTIDLHMNYMKTLTELLQNAGGRAFSCTLLSSDYQDTVYSAWCQGKVGTLKEVAKLESMADEEAAWAAQHPQTKYDDAQTATKALELYWSEIMGYQENRPRTLKKRAVVFSQETNFEPGRPNIYFHRRSPRYEPGKYTIAELEEEKVEDDVSEDSEDYSQVRVFHFGATEDPESETPALQTDDSVEELKELEEDDGDSDWEDIDEVGEDVYFEIEEETSFIVFGDD
ncbi:hypothetical protein EJ02DRAFT_12222 [Clathrospora elynae]|uniref:Uncharacterized protein n=1 Tax=Clathrospora elynae TaxID=706981 RepID=A0A6A5TGQ3_9PLEO|nr:hypothetical protein EJ02DRAFT_12222 [Clathrospora elynae]